MTVPVIDTRFTEQRRMEEAIRELEKPLKAIQDQLHQNKVEMLLEIMRQPNSSGNRTMLPVPNDFWAHAAADTERRWVAFAQSMVAVWSNFFHPHAHRTQEDWQQLLLKEVGKPKKDEVQTKAFVLVKEADLRNAFYTTLGHEPLKERFHFKTLEMQNDEWPLVRHFQNAHHEGWGIYFCPFRHKCARKSYIWMTDTLEEAQTVAMEISIRVQDYYLTGKMYDIPSGYHTLPRYVSQEELFFRV